MFYYNFYNITVEKIGILILLYTVSTHNVGIYDTRIRLMMSAHACVCESAVRFRKLGPVSLKMKSVTCNISEVITRYDYS